MEKFKRLQIDEVYLTLDLENLDDLKEKIATHDLKGFNVTIPYKNEIISHLDDLDGIAHEIGAVNCVDIKNGKWVGYNTDAYGFEKSLKPLLHKNWNKALIFGNGGAAKAIRYVLRKLGIDFLIVEREGVFRYQNLTCQMLREHPLWIQTTPVGTFPDIDEMLPIDTSVLNANFLVYDLIYNPSQTKLLKKAEIRGAQIKNGYQMLELQAEKSYKIWTSL